MVRFLESSLLSDDTHLLPFTYVTDGLSSHSSIFSFHLTSQLLTFAFGLLFPKVDFSERSF